MKTTDTTILGTKMGLVAENGRILISGALETPLEISIAIQSEMGNNSVLEGNHMLEKLTIEIGGKNDSSVYIGLRPPSSGNQGGCSLPGLTIVQNHDSDGACEETRVFAHNSCNPAINTLIAIFDLRKKK